MLDDYEAPLCTLCNCGLALSAQRAVAVAISLKMLDGTTFMVQVLYGINKKNAQGVEQVTRVFVNFFFLIKKNCGKIIFHFCFVLILVFQ